MLHHNARLGGNAIGMITAIWVLVSMGAHPSWNFSRPGLRQWEGVRNSKFDHMHDGAVSSRLPLSRCTA